MSRMITRSQVTGHNLDLDLDFIVLFAIIRHATFFTIYYSDISIYKH